MGFEVSIQSIQQVKPFTATNATLLIEFQVLVQPR